MTFALWMQENGYQQYNSAAGRALLRQLYGITGNDANANILLWNKLKENYSTKPVSLDLFSDDPLNKTNFSRPKITDEVKNKEAIKYANDPSTMYLKALDARVRKYYSRFTPLAISNIQERLRYLKYWNGSIDGKLSSDLIASILKFLADNKLEVDGIVGKNTLQKIDSKLNQTAYDLTHPSLIIPYKKSLNTKLINYGDFIYQ